MSNKVYITIFNEVELNADFTPKEYKPSTNVYINCDEISAWVGNVSNEEELMSLINPKDFEDTLCATLSQDEYDIISSALDYNDNIYWLQDKKFKVEL